MKCLTEPLTECGSVSFWSGRDVIPWLRASLSLSQTFQDPEDENSQSRLHDGRKLTVGEDKCFAISVSNWLKGTITFIFATEPLVSAKYIYASWQRLHFNFLAKQTLRHLFLQHLVKDPAL